MNCVYRTKPWQQSRSSPLDRLCLYPKQQKALALRSIHLSINRIQRSPAPTSGERLVIREKLHSTAMPKIKTHTGQHNDQNAAARGKSCTCTCRSLCTCCVKACAEQCKSTHSPTSTQARTAAGTGSAFEKAAADGKTTAAIAKRLGEAAVQTAKAMVSAVAGLFGGGVLLMLVCVVMLVAAVVASPFGILFTTEPSPGSITLNAAVAQINVEYNEKLEELQSGDYDSVQLHGAPPEWRQVVAVFAAKRQARTTA